MAFNEFLPILGIAGTKARFEIDGRIITISLAGTSVSMMARLNEIEVDFNPVAEPKGTAEIRYRRQESGGLPLAFWNVLVSEETGRKIEAERQRCLMGN